MRGQRISDRRTNWIVRALLIGLLVWLGWEVIGDTVADTSAESDPGNALSWRPHDPDALANAAQQKLAAGAAEDDLNAATDLAKRALHARPIDDGALRTLALVADLQSDDARADALMSLAGERSLRDTGAHVWLFDERLRQQKVGEALLHADVVLRTRPELLPEFVPALTSIAADDAARQVLVEFLEGNPPWRPAFLAELPRQASPLPATYAILSGLEGGNHPLLATELQPYLDQLIAQHQYDLAFLAWVHFLPPAQSADLPYLFNGDFDLPVSGISFDWMIANIMGATTEVVAPPGNEGRGMALRVVFSGRRVPYAQVSKLLLLPPGVYQLSGEAKADDLANERGMVWRVYCAEDPQQTLGTSDAVQGTNSWKSFTVGFEVPLEGCRAQWLRLELAAHIAIEQQVSGAVWYDHLAISRAAPESTSDAGGG